MDIALKTLDQLREFVAEHIDKDVVVAYYELQYDDEDIEEFFENGITDISDIPRVFMVDVLSSTPDEITEGVDSNGIKFVTKSYDDVEQCDINLELFEKLEAYAEISGYDEHGRPELTPTQFLEFLSNCA